MAEVDLRSVVLDCLKSVAPEAQVSQLDPAVSFSEQVDLDSVDYLNFVMAVEEKLGIRIAEEDYPRLSSLEGCLALLDGMSASSGELPLP